ncbi:hypothetical protein O0I10_003841 [Lichtheimia ornata]|uniref:Uncharacterized protein n=1 Tax=Lichtheimia ornata TaxID=688661 RepID=A0AAD7V6R8_9FUNG|nr:uncharacterized protein O0I10_003841 [Lichtheimia ornata]KAJ8660384.1 hypothetical protein O0I10_003841 [Lichtheimia ornata]
MSTNDVICRHNSTLGGGMAGAMENAGGFRAIMCKSLRRVVVVLIRCCHPRYLIWGIHPTDRDKYMHFWYDS